MTTLTEEAQQPPLSRRKKLLVIAGVAMFFTQVAAAVAIAPATTGVDDASLGVFAALWAGSLAWSAATVLLAVRQADRPDVATASFIVTIAAFAAFTLSAAVDALGRADETNLVDALFFGVTTGALTALAVWAIAEVAARLLRLPRSPAGSPFGGGDTP